PTDPSVIVEIEKPKSGVGTAFAINRIGTWLTARHVVDGCDQVGLRVGANKYVKTDSAQVSRATDTALIASDWKRPPLARDFQTKRQVGERGFFIGFPQGQPGEVAGKLLGRHRMLVRGRYKSEETILAWAEIGRTSGLKGSLGGISGGPVFDTDGEVIGIVAAESPRRGRIYTVAPMSLSNILEPMQSEPKPDPINMENYGREADKYRRTRRVTQVICLVN
ncbi:MAG: serine protease, partial [Acidimicrobiales bacterium]